MSKVHIGSGLLARNTLINLVGQLVPLVVALVAMKPVIDGLGTERTGVLAIAWMVLSYFSELGFGRATTKFAAEVLGRGEDERLASVTWTTVAIQAGFGLVGGAAFALATPLLVERVLQIPPALVAEARTSFYLLAVVIPAVLIGSSFRGVLEAAQRFDLINAVRVPSSAANFLLPLLGLAIGWQLPGILALLLASRLAVLVAFYVMAVRLFPTLHPIRIDRGDVGRLVSFGSWVTLSSIVSPVLVYLDRFLLGALVTITAVTYYTVPYELVVRLWIIPASLVATLFPAFSTLAGQGEWKRLERVVARSVKYVLFALGPAVVLLVVGARDVLTLWVGAEIAAESTLALQILAVGVLVNSLAFVPHSLIQGIGRADIPAKFHLLELPVQVVLITVFVRAWGVPGAAMAWSARVLLDAALLFGAARHLGAVGVRAMVAAKVPHTATMLLAFGAVAAAGAAQLPNVWARIGWLALILISTATAGWFYSLGEGDRADVKRLLQAAGAR